MEGEKGVRSEWHSVKRKSRCDNQWAVLREPQQLAITIDRVACRMKRR